MASIIASLPPPLLTHARTNTSLTALPKLPLCSFRERHNRVAVVVRATGDSSESSTSLSIVDSVKNAASSPPSLFPFDRIALVGLGFAAVVGLWASANMITAIDRLLLLPTVLEVVGILYSSWFIYRYLLFKPDREELFQIANKSISNILGQ